MLTALNLVREKEMGTTEQINVTPIRKYQFIVAKLVPFWIIALFELAFGLVVGRIALWPAHGGQPGAAIPLCCGVYPGGAGHRTLSFHRQPIPSSNSCFWPFSSWSLSS